MTQHDDRLTSAQADALRANRRARGFSQAYVGTLLGVTREWYNKIEGRQATIGLNDRRLLAQVLGIAPSLLGVTGGAVIPLPAGDLVTILWDQFYGGTHRGMLALVPYAQLWLDEQAATPSPNSATISQLYQAVASALQDGRMFPAALSAADRAITFAEHLSGPRDPNPDACTAYYRRSRVLCAMAQDARPAQRQTLLARALTDATEAAARAPEERLPLTVVSLQNQADLQALAGAPRADAVRTILRARSLAAGIDRPVRDSTGIVLSPAGLNHALARVTLTLARQHQGDGYLDQADDFVAQAIDTLSGVEHRWSIDMMITMMEVAAAMGNASDVGNLAPQISSALEIYMSQKLASRAWAVVSAIRIPRGNAGARTNLAEAQQRIRKLVTTMRASPA